MVGDQVEIYEADAPSAPLPGAPSRLPAPRAIAASTLWIAGAVLLVVAPFGDAYRNVVTTAGDVPLASAAVDGWGRLHGAGSVGGLQQTRYGIALYAVAGVLLLLAFGVAAFGVAASTRRPRGWVERAARVTAVVAPACLLGIVVAAGLAILGAHSQGAAFTGFAPSQSRAPSVGYPDTVSFTPPVERTAVGTGGWLALASLVIIGVAAVVYTAGRPRMAQPRTG